MALKIYVDAKYYKYYEDLRDDSISEDYGLVSGLSDEE